LTDKETELVAIGASIGAGCQPCTQYHVGAALKSGLTPDEVRRAIDEAQAVRREGGIAVSNVGRGILGIEGEQVEEPIEPGERDQALVYVGAAAGCNAARLLAGYVANAVPGLIAGEELRSALEMAETVKLHAAEFFRRDAEKRLAETGAPAPDASASPQSCCGPGWGK
jgi:AhpD family alkylhydroperoxidase